MPLFSQPETPTSFVGFFFFFNDTATTEIYTLSLHDALPISSGDGAAVQRPALVDLPAGSCTGATREDRKSTRLNSSHLVISYAVFCLKKKNIVIVENMLVRFSSNNDVIRIGTHTTQRAVGIS